MIIDSKKGFSYRIEKADENIRKLLSGSWYLAQSDDHNCVELTARIMASLKTSEQLVKLFRNFVKHFIVVYVVVLFFGTVLLLVTVIEANGSIDEVKYFDYLEYTMVILTSTLTVLTVVVSCYMCTTTCKLKSNMIAFSSPPVWATFLPYTSDNTTLISPKSKK